MDVAQLKEIIARKWPQTVSGFSGRQEAVYVTGIPQIDALFADGGIPRGQLIEITGGESSGKTSFLYKLLAAITGRGRVAYVDLHNSFFPAAAAYYGVDMERVVVVKPESGVAAARTTELLLQNHLADCVALDLVGERRALPTTLLHRLRMETVRSRALVVFLTDTDAQLFPSSTVSLRLKVSRREASRVEVAVMKSRISREGVKTELSL